MFIFRVQFFKGTHALKFVDQWSNGKVCVVCEKFFFESKNVLVVS